eukprot:356323-Chlamydomonas_euryale.AAC.13
MVQGGSEVSSEVQSQRPGVLFGLCWAPVAKLSYETVWPRLCVLRCSAPAAVCCGAAPLQLCVAGR